MLPLQSEAHGEERQEQPEKSEKQDEQNFLQAGCGQGYLPGVDERNQETGKDNERESAYSGEC